MKKKNKDNKINLPNKKGILENKIKYTKDENKEAINNILDGAYYENQKLCVETYEKNICLKKLISEIRRHYWKNKKTVFISHSTGNEYGEDISPYLEKIFDYLDFSSLEVILDNKK